MAHSGLAPAGVALKERRPPRAPKPAPPPLRHRHDGSTLLGLLAVVFGLAWLAAGTHAAHVSTEAVVAIALMVLGIGMAVTARTDWALSRRSWPLLGGAALALALVFLSVSSNTPAGFRHLTFGSRAIAPATWEELPLVIHGGVGRVTVDLTGIPGPLPAPKTVAIDNAAGQMRIEVPDGQKVVVDASVVAGQIEVNGVARSSGIRRSVDETLDPRVAGPALTLRIRAGLGNVSIIQDTALAPGLKPGPPAVP